MYCGVFAPNMNFGVKKQPLLVNGCVTYNNGVNVGSGVFCVVHDEAI
jgi:hypothetical protein